MKRTIGLAALMLTAVAAFAQPAAARENRRPVVVERARVDYGRRPVVVLRREVRRDPLCR